MCILILLSSIVCLAADELIENIFKTSGKIPFCGQRLNVRTACQSSSVLTCRKIARAGRNKSEP